MPTLLQDLRYALRLLFKAPLFSSVVVLTLAIGLGATTSIFAIVNSLLIKPLPYPDAGQLVMVWQDYQARGGPRTEWASQATFEDWRAHATSFDAMTVIDGWRPALTGLGEPEPLEGAQVSRGFLRVFGLTLQAGREFRSEEESPGAQRPILISDQLWRRRFNADPATIGRVLMLADEPHVVAGVMPPGFRAPLVPEADVFRLAPGDAGGESRGNLVLRVVARLRPDTTIDRAQAEMASLMRSLERTYEAYRDVGIWVQPLHEALVAPARGPVLVLFGSVVLVFLIACANITNLLLARASTRQREMAVRTALGAGRLRLFRQLVTESLVLAAVGAVAGALFAAWVVDSLQGVAATALPGDVPVRADWLVPLFAGAMAFLAALLFGTPAALHALGGELAVALRQTGRSTTGGGTRARSVLVVAELALAVMLLAGAGLLLRSLLHLQRLDMGFSPARVLTAQVSLPPLRYRERPQVEAFQASLLERVRQLPGVEAAGLVSVLPLSGDDTDFRFRIEGRPPASPTNLPQTWFRVADPGYFSALGIPLIRGRLFDSSDRRGSQDVIVINDTLARRYWSGADAVGQAMLIGQRRFVIVGIVSDVRHRGPEQAPLNEAYISSNQAQARTFSLVVRAASNPATLVAPLRASVGSLDPALPLAAVATMEELMTRALTVPRLLSILLATFAGTALLLAAIGIYGVLAFSVAQRTQEIGVRMALGAAGRDVLALVLRQATALTLFGIAAGCAAALALARLIGSVLHGVSPNDPLTFGATAAILTCVALAASYFPARRAIRVDPVTALRGD